MISIRRKQSFIQKSSSPLSHNYEWYLLQSNGRRLIGREEVISTTTKETTQGRRRVLEWPTTTPPSWHLQVIFLFLEYLPRLIPYTPLHKLASNSYKQLTINPTMEKTPPSPRCKFSVIYFIIISLSLGSVSFILCIAAEIKRNKEEDLRWNGKLCSLPTSPAFGLGIAALVSFSFAQIIGNAIIFKDSCSERKSNSPCKIPAVAKVLLLISWLSFGIAVILFIAATSLSRRQLYGVGWLNGECYLVKGGTYAGTAILVLVTVGSVNGSALSTIKSSQADQRKKIHKQIG